MKILLIGLGSIGLRHLRNILFLGYENVTVVSRSGNLPAEFSTLPVFSTLEEALSSSTFDAAIVCTPTSLHYTSIAALLEAAIPNIYIEKPISHSLDGIDNLFALATTYKNNIVVGYDLHFDLGLQKVKQLLDQGIIGQVVSANAVVGQYLPDWRPFEEYTKGMSAKKETGGGVMLDLVHEFDYLLWLIGTVQTVASQYRNSGSLNIETEDVADVLIKFKSGVTSTIHLDYLQQKLVRHCLFTGSKGSITWNLATSKVQWINNKKEQNEYDYSGFERNDRFIAIMKAFLEGGSDERLTSLEQGVESLKFVLAAKQSCDENRFIDIALIQPAFTV